MRKVHHDPSKKKGFAGADMGPDFIDLELSDVHFLPGPDNEYMVSTIESVLSNSTVAIHEMYLHLENKDYQSLRRIARDYKSLINVLGETKFTTLVKKIEEQAQKKSKKVVLTPLIKELSTISSCLMQQLNAEMKRLKREAA